MTDIVAIAGSAGVKNPMLDLFRVPPTDISIASYRMVPISPFTTGINPVDFQIDPQEDFVNLSRSYIELEWTLKKIAAGQPANTVAAEDTYLVNNIAHSLFKQINVRLNGTLISPQTDTYHYKAYFETLLNFNILKPQGWFNAIDVPDALTANQLDMDHDDHKAMTTNYQDYVKFIKAENAKHAGGKARVLCMVPHIEVFHLSKLLIPQVQISVQLYFNPPELWSMRYQGAIPFRLAADDIKARLFLCQVRVNPDIYLELMGNLESGRQLAAYPTVRSEVRTYNIQRNTLHVEINNPFQNRLPNMVLIGLVDSRAFNGDVAHYPFTFKPYNLKSISQLVRGEIYPFVVLELTHTDDSKDQRGYRQFLQATGSLCKSRGNMVRALDWGHDHHCTLFVYENAANGCLNSPVLNPQLSGEIRLVLDFGADQGVNLTALVYAEFETKLEIDSNKSVMYDVYKV